MKELDKTNPTFHAHLDRIVARRDLPTTTTGGGLHLSDRSVEVSLWATIVAAGPKAKEAGFDVGDRILVNYAHGMEQDFGPDLMNRQTYTFTSPAAILAKVT